jgi:hypothetical protein
VRFSTFHFWSLVLGAVLPLFPYFVYSTYKLRPILAAYDTGLSPWAPVLVLGPLSLLGLGLVGGIMSAVLRDWPKRSRYRFLLGLAVGTAGVLAGQLGVFQRN